jgi:hypothetical protein
VNILVLAALTEATGNAVTARRIAGHLATRHRVVLADANDASAPSLRALVERESIDVVGSGKSDRFVPEILSCSVSS